MDRKYLVESNFVDEKFSQIASAFVLDMSSEFLPGLKPGLRAWNEMIASIHQERLCQFLKKFQKRIDLGDCKQELLKLFRKTPEGIRSKQFVLGAILNVQSEKADDCLLNLFINYLDNKISSWEQFKTLCLVIIELDERDIIFLRDNICHTTQENLSDYVILKLTKLGLIKQRMDFNRYDFTEIARDLYRFAIVNKDTKFEPSKEIHFDCGDLDDLE